MNKTNKTKNLAYCALFTALIAVGAFIRVPVPVVPFTLQYLFTMLAGLLLGPRLGTIAVGTYVLLGLVGVPIFAQGGGFSARSLSWKQAARAKAAARFVLCFSSCTLREYLVPF